jgi:hypothetical protein
MATTEDVLREVTNTYLNTIPATRSDTPTTFIETAVTWIGGWWKMKPGWKSVGTGYCAFLLDPTFTETPRRKEFERVTMFRDAPAPNIGGAIYVCDYSLKKVFRLRGEFPDANAIISTIKARKLANLSCVLFEPEVGTLVLCSKGASEKDAVIQLEGLDATLTVANIDRILQSFYDSSLRYPTDFPHIWRNAEGFVPIFKAEKLFQSLVFLQLKAVTQKTCVVVKEDQTNAGRTDITIYSLNPECVFVMEFKVLKSFAYEPGGKPNRRWTLAKNSAHAAEGIEQVMTYRTASAATEAFLLLYDLRKKETKLKAIVSRCDAEAIRLRCYFIRNASPKRGKKPKRAQSKTR